MHRIAFIGLGHMGAPMASQLLAAGNTLYVRDLNHATVSALVAKGATALEDLSTLKDVDAVITMLQTGDQVKSVVTGNDGVFAHLNPKAIFIDCSSIAIEDTKSLHHMAAEKKLAMVDAPVSGGVKAAELGTLTIMVGGSEKHFTQAEPLLEPMAKAVIHAGKAGNGQVAKICNNMILGVSMIAVSEGFQLAEKLGLDAKTFFDIATNASSQCWSMSSYCPAPGVLDNVPSANHYQPGFTAAMMLKDLKLSQLAANAAGMQTVLGHTAQEMYQQFVDAGGEEVDFSGILYDAKH